VVDEILRHATLHRDAAPNAEDRVGQRARLGLSGGLSLAFVADLCIASEDARFTPAYAKLGISPDGGGTAGLVASVGARRALQIYLIEDSFSAAQAYDWGLVAKVVPAAELKLRPANWRSVWRKTRRRRWPRPKP